MTNSLRLAEAFLRAAAPEGHEPLRDLAELRGHMNGVHGLDVAGMLPQRVLLRLHEKEHADPGSSWHGSPDAASNIRFIANVSPMRKRAAAEDADRWERARPSLERNGITSRSDGLGIAHTETGHTLITPWNHSEGQWKLRVLHDSDPENRRTISASLGPGDDDVGERAMAALRRPDVLRAMRDQMVPGAENDGTWPRRFAP